MAMAEQMTKNEKEEHEFPPMRQRRDWLLLVSEHAALTTSITESLPLNWNRVGQSQQKYKDRGSTRHAKPDIRIKENRINIFDWPQKGSCYFQRKLCSD